MDFADDPATNARLEKELEEKVAQKKEEDKKKEDMKVAEAAAKKAQHDHDSHSSEVKELVSNSTTKPYESEKKMNKAGIIGSGSTSTVSSLTACLLPIIVVSINISI
jgi:hypothetical protein